MMQLRVGAASQCHTKHDALGKGPWPGKGRTGMEREDGHMHVDR